MSKAYEYIVVVKDKASKALEATSKAAGRADRDLRGMASGASGLSSKLGGLKSMLPSLGIMLAATFSIAGISRMTGAIFNTTAEFEKFRAVLDNTFQSQTMGAASMDMIAEFASNTPFQVNELTESFVKLSNRGLVPSQENMRQFGDIASSMGKSFDQFVEAALDAGTGEFERLKEFGIKAKVAGDNVTFMFKGQATTVKNSEGAINSYIQSLGDMKGVKGSMDVISKTSGGMLSNLQDKFTMLMFSIGEKLQPLFEKVFNKMGEMIDWVNSKDFGPFIDSFIAGLGVAWKITSALFNTISSLLPFLKNFAITLGVVALAWGAYNVVMAIADYQTTKYNITMWALNSSMLANPVGLIVVGIAAFIAILVTAYQKVGWFRGAIDAAWAAIKGFGIAIKDYVINRFKDLLSGIVGIGKTLMAFFKGDWKVAWETGKKAVGDLVGIDSKKRFVADMKNTGTDAAKAYNKGVAEVAANNVVKKKKKSGAFDFESERNKYLAGQGTGVGAGEGAGAGGKAGVNSITGGGSKQTNITINVGKLVEGLNINTTNLKESSAKIQQEVEKALLRVLNSANQMQTS